MWPLCAEPPSQGFAVFSRFGISDVAIRFSNFGPCNYCYPICDRSKRSNRMITASPSHPCIRRLHSASEPLLALNNDHAIELSALTLTEFDQLIRESFYAA